MTRHIRYGDRVHYGRINDIMVREHVQESMGSSFVFICGTRSFDKDMVNYVKKCEIPDEHFHKF